MSAKEHYFEVWVSHPHNIHIFPFYITQPKVLELKSHIYPNVENKVRDSESSTSIQIGVLTKDTLLENRHGIYILLLPTK